MNIDELERKHKAFMRYDGNDVVSLLIHAGELQTELLAEVKRLQARCRRTESQSFIATNQYKELIQKMKELIE